MEDDTITTFYQDIITNHTKLKDAYQLIKHQLTTDSNFATGIIEFLAAGQDNVKDNPNLYFHIVTLTHPVLVELFPDLTSNLQDDVRSGLLSAVVALHSSLKTVAGLALLIREIIEIDSLQPWIQPLSELLKWGTSDDLAAMQAGIEFFVYLIKETNYNHSNSQVPLQKLAGPLLQNFFQVLAHPQLSELFRQKLMYLVLQVIKTFSMYDGMQDELVKQSFDGTFELWMSLFISALQGSINLNVGIKKYILKILIVIFRDMQRYLSLRNYQQPAHIYVVWEFIYKALPMFLWAHVWDKTIEQYPLQSKNNASLAVNLPYYDDDSDALCSPLESLGFAALQFLSVLTSIPQLQTTLRLSTHHLANALFHYMLMSEADVLGWKANSQHFINQGGNMEYEPTIRNKAMSILNEMIQKFGDFAIQAILVISEKFLLNLQQQTTSATLNLIASSLLDVSTIKETTNGIYESQAKFSNLVKLSSCDIRQNLKVSGQSWRKVEVALLVLGRFSQDIIVFQSKQTGAFDIESFVKGIVRQVCEEDYYSLLKGQSLYCLTRFTQIISIKFRTLFGQLAVAAASCNNSSYPLPVRLISCKALSIFLKKMDKHKLQLTAQQLGSLQEWQIICRVVEMPLMSQTLNYIMQVLVELCKHKQLGNILSKPEPQYFLGLFHHCISQQSLLTTFIGLLQEVCEQYQTYSGLVAIFISFAGQCLKAFNNVLRSQQKKYLKSADTQLILTALRVASVFINHTNTHKSCQKERQKMVDLLPTVIQILDINQDVQVQVALSLYIKGVIRIASDLMASNKDTVDSIVNAVRILLRIPKDKSFESASIYAGNLIILLFDRLLKRNHNQILQQIVLKVFRSRTPSVIQSLVLVYAKLINQGTTNQNKFSIKGDLQGGIRGVVDFLSSFSIENRMGLKILIDKWLLQQSLFRGKYTKMATFMALSKLFLLSDKRVDNLLVIGFNPSHTNVNNDVNAPLKILATLIRCLDNELAGSRGRNEEDQDEENQIEMKEEGLEVNLEKFKEEDKQEEEFKAGGGLADRENQQGSTCYMSAMLQFYDDGQQCDDKTEQDLIFLKDTSTQFSLAEYLTQFFQFLAQDKADYLKECLKGLLRKDMVTLQKYIKIA